MKLFKYLKKEHLEKFMSVGSLRIGTLLDYQQGVHGDMVSDSSEGVGIYHGHVKHLSPEKVAEIPVLSQIFQRKTLIDCDFSNVQLAVEDFYIYSASTSYSSKTHEQWLIKENYDACLIINSPTLFMDAISNAIRIVAIYRGLHHVNYHPNKSIKITSPLAKVHPALLKFQRDFGNQNEMRAIWSSKNSNIISPKIINVPSAIQYCSVYKVLDQEMKKDQPFGVE